MYDFPVICENIIIVYLSKLKIAVITNSLSRGTYTIIYEDLFATQQGELNFIFNMAFKKYPVNIAKMKQYATRRSREQEIENRIILFLAN